MRIVDALSTFSTEGFVELPGLLDADAAQTLLQAIMATRAFDRSLFRSEADWNAGPKTHKNTNPGPGYNLLESFQPELAFIERQPALTAMLTALLGPGYRILDNKVICRLPWSAVPDWLQALTRGKPCNTFGAFVKPEYRNVLYFVDNDLHQDIQDWNRMPPAAREHRYVTLYVYLGDVTADDAPVHLLPKSHLLGATPFQHDVTYDAGTRLWLYRDGKGGRVSGDFVSVVGGPGHAALWHPCLIHGGPPLKEGHFRLSLRYIVGRAQAAPHCALDDLNARITGPLYLTEDQTPGAHADPNGMWNLRMTDFIRRGYERMGMRA